MVDHRGLAGVLFLAIVGHSSLAAADDVVPVVEVEEDVYSYSDPQNGSGPMWCAGSTTLVRSDGKLFASGIETIAEAKPLNNCRWVFYGRSDDGWKRVRADADGRTREPSPLAAFPDGRVFLSVNPTLSDGPESRGGPARPDVLQFLANDPAASPSSLSPVWNGSPPFSEHSYRSFAADGPNRELLLLQNIGYDHAEWTFRDRDGRWSAQGQIRWPLVGGPDKPVPLRLCYPNVALKDRAVYFLGAGDVFEPNPEFHAFKKKLTGQDWDYLFCRLEYSWTPDIRDKPFAEWVSIADREATRGHVWPCDLWVAPGGDVHILWSERVLDERLRKKFFPEAKQAESLNLAVIREGKVIQRTTVAEGPGQASGLSGLHHRFQATPDNRLFIVYGIAAADKDGRRALENRLVEVLPDGRLGEPAKVPLNRPFASFFTATPRAGSPPSWTLDMLGIRPGASNTIGYARVRLAHPGEESERPSAR